MTVHTRTITNAATAWSFDLEEDSTGTPAPGGLIVKNLRHDGHTLARDVRLIGIWLKFENVDPAAGGAVTGTSSRFVPLTSQFFTGAAITEINAGATSTPPAADVSMANYFFPGYGLRALYVSTASVFGGLTNCVMGELRITQSWQFSSYGNNPMHEPSGGLSAARFHPITTYRLVLSPTFDFQQPYVRVASIRFDYRLHLTLDRTSTTADPASATPSNHAGLFRDRDSPPISTQAGTSGAGFSFASFECVEKPLVYEVVAPGLQDGRSAIDLGALAGGTPRQNVKLCWDNVHWWAHRSVGHISAPGAFHCAHMHWRWGAPISMFGGLLPTPPPVPNLGNFLPPLPRPDSRMDRQSDYLANGSIFGALVDPAIWAQTLRVAVTRHDPALDPTAQPLASLSTANFNDLFTNRGAPARVYAGADQVLWYSFEVPRQVTTPVSNAGTMFQYGGVTYANATGGSVFLHGLFFAHDPERTGRFIGDTAELHRPKTLAQLDAAPTWFRPAD